MGIEKDLLLVLATITGERDKEGAVADVDTGRQSKNPHSLRFHRTAVFHHLEALGSWLG